MGRGSRPTNLMAGQTTAYSRRSRKRRIVMIAWLRKQFSVPRFSVLREDRYLDRSEDAFPWQIGRTRMCSQASSLNHPITRKSCVLGTPIRARESGPPCSRRIRLFRFDDFGQLIRFGLIANEVRILFSAVIVKFEGSEVIGIFDKQFQGHGSVLALSQRVAQNIP
jgi:hypothetical protein